MSSASEIADRLEMGLTIKKYNSRLERDLAVMKQRHMLEEEIMYSANSHMHPDCHFREYDWDSMYEEDKYCDDRDYIPKLKKQLRDDCECPDHKHD